MSYRVIRTPTAKPTKVPKTLKTPVPKAPGGNKVGPVTTRFPRILTPVNPLDTIKNTRASMLFLQQNVVPKFTSEGNVAASGAFTIQTSGKNPVQPVPLGSGYKPQGHFYNLDMSFLYGNQNIANKLRASVGGEFDDEFNNVGKAVPAIAAGTLPGSVIGNPLTNPSTNSIYIVRIKISLLGGEPLLSGFVLVFQLPAGWRWVDGFGPLYTIECVSNPTVLDRVVLSPTVFTPGEQGQFDCAVKTMVPGTADFGQPMPIGIDV